MQSPLLRRLVLSVAALVLLIMLTACAGVGTNSNGSASSITGTITTVNAANHSVTLATSNQAYTVNGLSDQEVQALQGQVGKTYTIQVTRNSDGSYSITEGTNPMEVTDATSGVNGILEATATPDSTTAMNAPGNFTLVGSVQSISSNSLTVLMPDRTPLTIAITPQTDQSPLEGTQLSTGQKVKVDVIGASNGLIADELRIPDADDLANATTIDFKGATTQTVGPDHMLHFNVGTRAFSYTLSPAADLDDFNGDAGNIASGTPVRVRVQFNGTTGSVIRIRDDS